jgi:hypothetical protein
MAIIEVPITENKWLIFFLEGDSNPVNYFQSEIGVNTSYCDDCWTLEEYNTELAWLERLLEFGIIPNNEI